MPNASLIFTQKVPAGPSGSRNIISSFWHMRGYLDSYSKKRLILLGHNENNYAAVTRIIK